MVETQLAYEPKHFNLQNIVDKEYWCEHQLTEQYFIKEMIRYNSRFSKDEKKQKLRLNAFNTLLRMVNSIINDYNSAKPKFIYWVNGKMYYKASKFMNSEYFITTSDNQDDTRTASNHLSRIMLAVDNGCKIFLSYEKVKEEDKQHRFDQNISFEINPELFEITDRRQHYKS